MMTQSPTQPAVVGSTVSMASGVFSFFGSSLVVVQWLAAAVSLVVGVLTAIHLIRNWVRNK